MKLNEYYQVEFKNPDDFLKTQTEDFIKTNRLLLLQGITIITLFLRKVTMIKKIMEK